MQCTIRRHLHLCLESPPYDVENLTGDLQRAVATLPPQESGVEPEPEAIQSLQDTGAGENVEDLNALEQLPEPEPIPQVFQTDAEDEAGAAEVEKGGMGKIIGIVAAVLVVAIIAGMFFGRGFIVGLWPGAAGIYAMVGLGGEELGAGLEIRDVTSARTVEGGVDALVVSGVVARCRCSASDCWTAAASRFSTLSQRR